ncbi:hypothetical protein HPB47_024192, partial [Ixodes persulcatus]
MRSQSTAEVKERVLEAPASERDAMLAASRCCLDPGSLGRACVPDAPSANAASSVAPGRRHLDSGCPIRQRRQKISSLVVGLQGIVSRAECERLGFHGARLNPCGFCVGGSTGLEPGHGRDCKGSCGGRARRDCHGVCGGSAYLDPCSGNCLYGKFSKVYGDTATSEEHRDCRGLCLAAQGGKSAFVSDACGVCVRGPAQKESPFKDCLGVCRLPGQHRERAELVCATCVGGNGTVTRENVTDSCGRCKAAKTPCECDGCVVTPSLKKTLLVISRLPAGSQPEFELEGRPKRAAFGRQHRERAELVCATCVGGNGTVTRENVTDSCGRCKAAKTPCECDGQGEQDVCGVCNGRGSSCFLLTGITPAVVPADVDVKITLLGAFSGETRDVLCVFRRRDAAVVGGSTEPTTVTAAGRGNGTSFTCQPSSFQQGTYLVTPRLSRLGKEVNNSNVILTVFNKEVGFDKMEPTSAPYRKEENKGDSLRLVFTGGDVPKFPLYCILQPTERSQRPTVVPPSGPAPASHSQCHVPFQKTSGDFVVFPSLDGQHPLSRGFNLSLYATRPQIKAAYITGDGSSAVVLFDRPVNVCRLDECSAILAADTLNAVDGENSQCLWATKHQLIIQLGKSVAGEKLRLSLNSDMITEDKQSVVMNIGEDLKVDARRVAPPNPGPLLAAISGPTVAPRCGRLELTVHYSWGAGPVEAFAWTATRNDSAPLEDHLKALLKGNNGPYLILEAEDLEMEMQYKFTVK